ncbi:unnamed protein product [Prunus brigantina]
MDKMKGQDEEAWKDKFILTCLEMIRVYIMLRMANRRIAGTVWRHPIGPRIVKIIEKNKLGASQCIPRLASESKYQVSHMYGGEYAVDLKAKICSCRRWDLCGIPCSHAISCIFQKEANVFDYAHDCYKKEAYLSSYEPVQPGRPKKSRNKEPVDVEVPAPVPPNPLPLFYNPPPTMLRRIYVQIRCSICGQEGHNKRRHANQGTTQAIPNQPNQGSVASSTVQGAAQFNLISPTQLKVEGEVEELLQEEGDEMGEEKCQLEEEMLEMGQQKCQIISHHHNHSHHHHNHSQHHHSQSLTLGLHHHHHNHPSLLLL